MILAFPGFVLTRFLLAAEKVVRCFPTDPFGISDGRLAFRQRTSESMFNLSLERGGCGCWEIGILQLHTQAKKILKSPADKNHERTLSDPALETLTLLLEVGVFRL